MREIKFRGKDVDSGEWRNGSLVTYPNGLCEIVVFDDSEILEYEVDVESVGQFTGLHDKNGEEIYFGDIVRNKWGGLGVVVWEECSVNVNWGGVDSHSLFYEGDFEHIGNIHDNPNLLTDGRD